MFEKDLISIQRHNIHAKFLNIEELALELGKGTHTSVLPRTLFHKEENWS
jgi:hypothetical protein